MRRILVTGAGGYIGTTLVPLLLDAGYAVRGLDRFFFGEHLLPPHPLLERIKADVRMLDSRDLDGIDAVIDLAALSNDASGERFAEATLAVNHQARARCARLARDAGVTRYILPSSCSVYGHVDADAIADEGSPVSPLTTYARANLAAERDVLELGDSSFCVVVLRQATVFGYSPRMRFDLAINGMTWGAWKHGLLPLMRDGQQWRPMVHVRDAAAAIRFVLEAPAGRVAGQVINVGADATTYRLQDLAELVAAAVPRRPRIEWYGDPDRRSYRVAFDKIEALGWRASLDARAGVAELVDLLEAGAVTRSPETMTLDWYEELERWAKRIREVGLGGGIVDIDAALLARDTRPKA